MLAARIGRTVSVATRTGFMSEPNLRPLGRNWAVIVGRSLASSTGGRDPVFTGHMGAPTEAPSPREVPSGVREWLDSAPDVAEAVEGIRSSKPPPAFQGWTLYPDFSYDVTTSTPYPIFWLNPEGSWYPVVYEWMKGSGEILQWWHELVGLPWWASIVSGLALVRAAFIPASIYALRNARRAFHAQPEVQRVMLALRRAQLRLGPAASAGESFETRWLTMKGVRAALHKHDCFPGRSLGYVLLQFPVLISAAMGARHAVLMGDESWEKEGLFWFQDLTVSDPTYALPVIALFSSYVLLEEAYGRARAFGGSKLSGNTAMMGWKVRYYLKNTAQLWLLATIPFTIQLPAGLYLGWITATWYTMAWLKILRSDAMHKVLTGREAPRSDAREDDLFDIGSIPEEEVVPAATAAQKPVIHRFDDDDDDESGGRGGSGGVVGGGGGGGGGGGSKFSTPVMAAASSLSSVGAASSFSGVDGSMAMGLGLESSGVGDSMAVPPPPPPPLPGQSTDPDFLHALASARASRVANDQLFAAVASMDPAVTLWMGGLGLSGWHGDEAKFDLEGDEDALMLDGNGDVMEEGFGLGNGVVDRGTCVPLLRGDAHRWGDVLYMAESGTAGTSLLDRAKLLRSQLQRKVRQKSNLTDEAVPLSYEARASAMGNGGALGWDVLSRAGLSHGFRADGDHGDGDDGNDRGGNHNNNSSSGGNNNNNGGGNGKKGWRHVFDRKKSKSSTSAKTLHEELRRIAQDDTLAEDLAASEKNPTSEEVSEEPRDLDRSMDVTQKSAASFTNRRGTDVVLPLMPVFGVGSLHPGGPGAGLRLRTVPLPSHVERQMGLQIPAEQDQDGLESFETDRGSDRVHIDHDRPRDVHDPVRSARGRRRQSVSDRARQRARRIRQRQIKVEQQDQPAESSEKRTNLLQPLLDDLNLKP